jgi:hypothetical protein
MLYKFQMQNISVCRYNFCFFQIKLCLPIFILIKACISIFSLEFEKYTKDKNMLLFLPLECCNAFDTAKTFMPVTKHSFLFFIIVM